MAEQPDLTEVDAVSQIDAQLGRRGFGTSVPQTEQLEVPEQQAPPRANQSSVLLAASG